MALWGERGPLRIIIIIIMQSPSRTGSNVVHTPFLHMLANVLQPICCKSFLLLLPSTVQRMLPVHTAQAYA
jgi:hypothetical protein